MAHILRYYSGVLTNKLHKVTYDIHTYIYIYILYKMPKEFAIKYTLN